MAFAARYLTESRNQTLLDSHANFTTGNLAGAVLLEPASRLIWICNSIAFQEAFSVLALFLNARFRLPN
jgi:hypothetical protein